VYYAADVRLLFASDEGGESGVLPVRVPSTQQPPSTAMQSMMNPCRSSSGSSQAGIGALESAISMDDQGAVAVVEEVVEVEGHSQDNCS
jgi:hypothetical protein